MKRAKMGVCPLCGGDIYTDQPTAWRTVDGSPARVHGTCLAPPVTRRKVALPRPTGYAEAAATRAVQGGHTMPKYRIAPAPGRRLAAVCEDCGWRSEPTTSGGMAGAKFDRHCQEKHS